MIIGFGGGCHWCTEAVFDHVRGVRRVEQGFIAADPPHDAPSEAVRLDVDTGTVPLAVLIEIHLRTHSSTSRHALRGKYRSAVYTCTDADADAAWAILEELQADFSAPLVTQVLPLRAFTASPPVFQNYYARDAERPFCRTYIDPKLQKLRRDFAAFARA